MSGATVISSDDRRLAVTCAAAWIAGWHRLRRQPGASSGSGPNTWTRSRSGRACRPSGAWSPRSAPRGWNTRACAPVRRSAHCRASSARAFSLTCAPLRPLRYARGARCAMSGGGLLGSYAPGARRCLRIQAICHGTAAISANTPGQNSHRGVCQNSQAKAATTRAKKAASPILRSKSTKPVSGARGWLMAMESST